MVYRWGESPGVSWLVLHVQEIKELLRRWKGGGGATALLPNSKGRRWREDKDAGGKNSGEKKKKKKRQREIRNEEKIGKRAIREGKQ